MEKPFGHYFQAWSPYYQMAQCNQKMPILVSSRRQVRSEKAKKKKKISINTNCSYHNINLPRSVLAEPTIKPDSVLTKPIGREGLRSWSV